MYLFCFKFLRMNSVSDLEKVMHGLNNTNLRGKNKEKLLSLLEKKHTNSKPKKLSVDFKNVGKPFLLF